MYSVYVSRYALIFPISKKLQLSENVGPGE
jgi:hypothetical protein